MTFSMKTIESDTKTSAQFAILLPLIAEINKVKIDVSKLVEQIHEHGQYLKQNSKREDLREIEGEDEFSGTDARLQVRKYSWQLHTGDAQYDTNHRGYWGNASIPWGCTWIQAREVAKELLESAEEDFLAVSAVCEVGRLP